MILEIDNLCVDLGEFKLNGVSLKADRGDYIAIIGPTGSGKSIVLETVAGFYKPIRGKIRLEGRDITFLPIEKRNVSIVYQDHALFPHMSVFENIAYGLKKKERNSSIVREEVRKIAKILGISHLLHRKPDTLSGGEQQRVAIARALVVKPKLLLMDEPFSALDVKTRENLRKLVKKAVKKYDTTVLHVTHDFEDVFSLANKVAVMKDGEIVQTGRPEEIFSRPLNDFVADFVGSNILDGVVTGKKENLTEVRAGDCVMYSTDHADEGEEVRISVRPENMEVSVNPPSSGNAVRCRVEDVRRSANSVWLVLKSGNLKFKAVVTPRLVDSMKLDVGKEVFVSFKFEDTRIIKR